jgi:tetratricopeptide (TPR) repeat protein
MPAEDHYKRGQARLDAGDPEGAIAAFDEAIRLDPTHAPAYNERGVTHYRKGDYDGAVADFSEAIRLAPRDPAAYRGRAAACFDSGEYGRALADSSEVLRLDPTSATDYYERGLAYLCKADYDSAIRDFTKRLESEPKTSCARCYRAFALEKSGDDAAAARDYAEALRLDPEHAKKHLARAFEAGDRSRAIMEFSIVMRLDPQCRLAYAGRANAYRGQGRVDQAIDDCASAVQARCGDAMVYAVSGAAYADKGEHDKAIMDCTEAIRLDPDCAMAYTHRGGARVGKGDLSGAIADCTVAIRLAPEDADAYLNRGDAYCAKEDFENAIADYTAAIQLNPRSAPAHSRRASAYRGLGDKSRSAADEQRTLALSGLVRPEESQPGAPARLAVDPRLVTEVDHLGQAVWACGEAPNAGWASNSQQVAFLRSHRTPSYYMDPASEWLVASSLVAELWGARADGSAPRRLTQCVGARFVSQMRYATSPRWSPDGKRLACLFGQMLGGRVVYRHATAGPVVIEVGYAATRIAIRWGPDSSWAPWGQLVLLEAATGEPSRLGYLAASLRWAPDSQSLAIVGCREEPACQRGRQFLVAVVGADGGTFRKIADVSDAEIGDWSPDGTQLLYTTWRSASTYEEWARTGAGQPPKERAELWVGSLDGSTPRRVATRVAGPGIWSSEAQWIAYTGDRTEPGLWRVHLATGERESVIEGAVRFAQCLRDGTTLFYLREEGERKTDLYLLQTRDGQGRQVTTSGNVIEAQASPDGTHAVVVARDEEGEGRCDTYLLTLRGMAGH